MAKSLRFRFLILPTCWVLGLFSVFVGEETVLIQRTTMETILRVEQGIFPLEKVLLRQREPTTETRVLQPTKKKVQK